MVSRISLLLLTIASLILTAYFGAEAWADSDCPCCARPVSIEESGNPA
jgi:hypothetical protein